MKIFNDLTFIPHEKWKDATCATIEFDNDTSIYVVTGGSSFTDDERPYECIIKDKIGGEMLTYCTKSEVTRIMKQLQEL